MALSGREAAFKLPREKHDLGTVSPRAEPIRLFNCRTNSTEMDLLLPNPPQSQALGGAHLCSETQKRILQISDAQG